MLKPRLIACLVLKDGWVVQSINFSKYLPVGSPDIAVEYLARWDVDEIVLLDISATPQGRNPNFDLVARVSEDRFVPLTVGGGITSTSDIRELIHHGADKISINTAAINNPAVIEEGANLFGAQCIIVSIDVKKNGSGDYEVCVDSGSRGTGLHPVNWAKQVEQLGAGEILLNSIDRDGSKQGYDLQLVKMVADAVTIPVIACGGVGRFAHFVEGARDGHASAVAAANIFHFMEHSVIAAKAYIQDAGTNMRLDSAVNYAGFGFSEIGRVSKKPGLIFNPVHSK